MLRVITNSTIYTYQKNLLKSTNQLYSAMSAMMSGRNFDSYSADPAAATRAFKIHSSLNATNAQYSNNTTVLNKFSTAWDVADDMIDKLVSDLAQAPALKGLSDTNLSTLNTQGDVIYSGAEAIIQSLNGKYDDNYSSTAPTRRILPSPWSRTETGPTSPTGASGLTIPPRWTSPTPTKTATMCSRMTASRP